MKKYFAYSILPILLFALTGTNVDNSSPLWMRYSAISPDGKTIAFSYKGDIYKVASQGGQAVPLTLSEGHDFMPVWSPDGNWIAFASDRNGNYDIYLMPANGGTAKRLTYHSASDYPYCFSPDGTAIYFASSRLKAVTSVQFPYTRLTELYSVSTNGGKESQVISFTAEDAKWDKAGKRLLYHDKKGYEDAFRKHHTSSITRDLWMYNKTSDQYIQLTDFAGEDRNPIWSPDESEVYYLSEKSGSFNVWKFKLDNPGQATQISKFEKHPVRFLSSSTDGTLCYGYNGELYTQKPGSDPVKVNVQINTDERYTPEKTEVFKDGTTEMEVSPNGKEIVFVVRGEVFVTSLEGGITKRITNTPEQERSVSFSPDGRSILYASERNNVWGIYQTSLARKEENLFFNSTILKEEPVVVSNAESFQPRYSPDGNEVAFLEERTTLKIINLKTKAVRTILPGNKNYSYKDGDQWFDWSPDGKWMLVQFLEDNHWLQQIGLIETSGNGKLIDLTQSGYDNSTAKWMMSGKMMIWFSTRDGMKNHASHGSQSDVYGIFFTRDAYDRFKLSKEDFALLKEQEDKEKKKSKEKKEEDKSENKTKEEKEKIEAVKIDLTNIEDRKERLTIHSSDLSDAVISNDGEQLFYLCKFEKGYDLWVRKFRENETKLLIKLDGDKPSDLKIDKEGKNLFLIHSGKVVRVNIEKLEKVEKKDVPYTAEMNLNTAKEREYLFEHTWRQVLKKFYVSNLQGVDWNFYKKEYQRFLPYINNNRDFSEMLSEILGELNASHTGGRYLFKTKNGDETASLGAFYSEAYTGKGVKIAEIINKSPLQQAKSQIKTGTVIEKIDGKDIDNEHTINQLLNRKAGKYTLLSLYDETTQQRWEETVKPIALNEEGELLYQRWVAQRRTETEKLSNGRIGYVHVRGMNDASFRVVYEEVLGKHGNKEALIVDTRFNGGGWLHDDLATFLNGKKYVDLVPREQKIGFEPDSKWTNPSVVLMGEGNYSDAHFFPFVYKELGVGKLIGMPVPGTATAVWWETLQDPTLVFGIPQVGVVSKGNYLENTQLEPDYKVMNEPAIATKGRDQQIEKAVEVLLKELGNKK